MYKYNEFSEVNALGVKYGSESWQRLQVFVSSLAAHTYNAPQDRRPYNYYFTRDEIRVFLGRDYWKDRLYTLLDAEILQKEGKRNGNNYYQELYTFNPVYLYPYKWLKNVTYPRIVNSLNIYYDNRATRYGPVIRKAILPGLRKAKIEISQDELRQITTDRNLWAAIKGFNAVEAWQLYDYITVDSFGHRVHTIITRLPKQVRQYITLGGQEVIEYDLHQAQAMFLDRLLRNLDPGNSFSSFYASTQDIYQAYTDQLGLSSRDEGKKYFCRMLFGRNNGKPFKAFLSQFNDAGVLLRQIKAIKGLYPYKIKPGDEIQPYKYLALLLQREESNFFSGIWIALRRKKIPFVTVHDSIILPRAKAQEGYEIIVNQLNNGNFLKYKIHTQDYDKY